MSRKTLAEMGWEIILCEYRLIIKLIKKAFKMQPEN
jgi:hypothetical protein